MLTQTDILEYYNIKGTIFIPKKNSVTAISKKG